MQQQADESTQVHAPFPSKVWRFDLELGPSKMNALRKPYLIYLADIDDYKSAKTGFGLRDWIAADVVGQFRRPGCGIDLGIGEMNPAAAAAAGAKSMVIGVAPHGGRIKPDWVPDLVAALDAGLDIVSGLHTQLGAIEALAAAAARTGRALHDVRYPGALFPIANGSKRSGKRLLTVGTDCALGKKYTALAIAKEMQARGICADFRATGQTGIMISGGGVAVDAVVSDFVSGAAETLSPAAEPDHWDVIEGQGAIFHPAYAGVTLGLLHGSQPDALVLCHDPARTEISSFPGFPIRPLAETMALYVTLATVTNPAAKFVAISLNTSSQAESHAIDFARSLEVEHGIPCFDPMRFGLGRAVESILAR